MLFLGQLKESRVEKEENWSIFSFSLRAPPRLFSIFSRSMKTLGDFGKLSPCKTYSMPVECKICMDSGETFTKLLSHLLSS